MNIPSYAQAPMKAYQATGSIDAKGRVELDAYDVEDTLDGLQEQTEAFIKADNGPLDLDRRPNFVEANLDEFDGVAKGGFREGLESAETWMTVKSEDSEEAFFYIKETETSVDAIAVGREDIDEPYLAIQNHLNLNENPELDSGYILHT